jgi:hypothetical protein
MMRPVVHKMNNFRGSSIVDSELLDMCLDDTFAFAYESDPLAVVIASRAVNSSVALRDGGSKFESCMAVD